MPILILILFYELWAFMKSKRFPYLSLFFLSGVIGAIIFINLAPNYGNLIQSLRNFVKPFSFALGLFMIPYFLTTKLKLPVLITLFCGVIYSFHFSFNLEKEKERLTNFDKILIEHFSSSPNKSWAISTYKHGFWNYTFEIPGKKLLNLKDSKFPVDISGCIYEEKNLEEWCINSSNTPCCGDNNTDIESLFNKHQIKYLVIDHQLETEIKGLNLISRDSIKNLSFYSFNLKKIQ